MPYNAGTAYLNVVPSFKGIQRAIQAEMRKAGIDAGREFNATFEKAVQKLVDKRIKVDLNSAGAMAELQRIRDELDKLGADSADISVRVDAAIASAQISAMQTQVERLDGQEANVRVDADTGAARANLASVGNEAYRSAGSVSALAIVGASLGPLIVPAAAAAVAGILAIGSAAAVGIGAVGVLTLGFSGIGEAVSALGDAQDDAGKRAQKAASSHLQVANAADGVRSAEASLANTRANAAEGARRAADQVRDAERSLADAQANARLAQVALTEARADARRALEDMNRSLKQGALDQRQATLDQSKAKADLDKVLKDPKATEQQRQQAQLTYDQATQRLEDIAVRQKRLAADAAKANKAGVEGSRQVQAAHQGVRKAQNGVAEAQQRLADAVRSQTTQQRQSAFALAQAQQGVVSAQRALTQATTQAGASGSASMDKLKKAMDALTPAGRSFALFLFGLKPIFKQLKAAAEGGLLPGVEAGIKAVLPIMPTIVNLVRVLASAMGELFKRAGQALASPFWVDFFNFIAAQAGPMIRDFGSIMGNLARVFAVLLQAFAPVSRQISAGLVTLTKKFADFITRVVSGKGFQQFVDYLIDNGPQLAQLFIDLAVITIKLLIGLAPLADKLLDLALSATKFLAALPPETLGKIATAIIAMVLAFQGVQGIIAIVSAVSAVIAFLLSPIGLVIIAVVAFIAIWVLAYTKLDWFRKAVNTWFTLIGTTAKWLWNNAIKPAFEGIAAAVSWAWNNVIKPAFNAISWVIDNVLAPAFFWLWRNVIMPVWRGIQLAIGIAWALIKVIFGIIQINLKILAGAFSWLYSTIIKPVWDKIAAAISWVWRTLIKPVFEALGNFIKDKVAPAFRRGVDAIGKAWEGIRNAAKAPVKFIVETVLNNGILAAYNKIAKLFKVKPDNVKVALPKGFASGGIPSAADISVWPGYTPGRDTGFIAVGGGEGILRPELTRALGSDWVHEGNKRARAGGVSGAMRFLGGYADGGIVGWLKETGRNAKDWVLGNLGAMLGPLTNRIKKLLGEVPTTGGSFAEAMKAVPLRALDNLLGWVKAKDIAQVSTGGAVSPNLRAGMSTPSVAAILAVAKRFYPGAMVSSGLRNTNDYHGRGLAADLIGGGAAGMRKMAAGFYNLSGNLLELIHSNGSYFVKNGQRVGAGYYRSVIADHYDHVHVASTAKALGFDQGGYLQPGLNIAYNGTGRPEPVLTSRQFADMSRDRGGDMTLRVLVDDGAVRGLVRVEVDEAHGALANAMIYRIGG